MSGRAKVKVQYCQPWERWLDSNLFVTLPSQLRGASRQSAPAVAAPRSHPRLWLGENVAAVHPSDGGRMDGSRVVAQRSAPLPGAAVAASSSAVTRSLGR